MYPVLPNKVLLHSTYTRGINGDDALIAAVKDTNPPYDTSLQIIPNPECEIYVTRKALRTNKQKLEYIHKDDCDKFICPYKDQFAVAAKALGIRECVGSFIRNKLVKESPYTYGMGYPPGVHLRHAYTDAATTGATDIRNGLMDLETSVLGDHQILLGGYADWHTHTVNVIVNGPWMRKYTRCTDDNDIQKMLAKRTREEYPKFFDGLNDDAKEALKITKDTDLNKLFKVKYHIINTEEELLQMLFKCIHFFKPEFCGVWNIDYDIPYINNRCDFLGIEPASLFCSPDVPPQYRTYEWKKTYRYEHLADAWHQVICPGITRWFDPMCLYGRKRKVKGREAFYNLEYLAQKIIGMGKMNFGDNQGHYDMQTKDPVGYAVYNGIDCVAPLVMEAVMQDLSTLINLTDRTRPEVFDKQTVMLSDAMYSYLDKRNYVPSTVMSNIALKEDVYIGNIGGAVLEPAYYDHPGLVMLEDSNTPSYVYKLVCDIDVSSFYPSITAGMNISKSTKKFTILGMQGCPYKMQDIDAAAEVLKDNNTTANYNILKSMTTANAEYITEMCGQLINSRENAVNFCNQYFGLPNYTELLNEF